MFLFFCMGSFFSVSIFKRNDTIANFCNSVLLKSVNKKDLPFWAAGLCGSLKRDSIHERQIVAVDHFVFGVVAKDLVESVRVHAGDLAAFSG